MKEIPDILKRFWVQIVYFLIVPSFFMAFVLIYEPLGIYDFYDMGRGFFSLNLSVVTSIIFLIVLILRLVFYFLRKIMRMTGYLYLLWCMGEILVMSIFVTLYLYLMNNGSVVYFEVFGKCVIDLYTILIYPYLLVTLAVILVAPVISPMTDGVEERSLIRFYDEHKKLKMVIASSAVLYIEAEENYVRINYMDADKLKYYVLRNSMKGIEETVSRHSLVRCQRSYYVNPSRVKVLRKDKDGLVFAQLDVIDAKQIPVSKKYYENLSALL